MKCFMNLLYSLAFPSSLFPMSHWWLYKDVFQLPTSAQIWGSSPDIFYTKTILRWILCLLHITFKVLGFKQKKYKNRKGIWLEQFPGMLNKYTFWTFRKSLTCMRSLHIYTIILMQWWWICLSFRFFCRWGKASKLSPWAIGGEAGSPGVEETRPCAWTRGDQASI